MAKKDARDWAQLDAFDAEYAERLTREKKRNPESPFFRFLYLLHTDAEFAYTDDIKARDDDARRLFALRGKIVALREKLAVPAEENGLLPAETGFLPKAAPREKRPLHVTADVLPANHIYPMTFAAVRETLATLPPEHAAVVSRVHLTNRKNEAADGDWGWGEIRLHCVLEAVKNAAGETVGGRRAHGKQMSDQDVVRFGGRLEWDGNKLYAVWGIEAYKTFVLKRVLVHEVAHGIAELPGYAAQVKSAGSVEKFCEQYAESFHRPPGKSVRLGF